MKNLVPIVLLLLFRSQAWGQEPDTTKPRPLHIGFQASPDFSYRVLKTGAEDNWMKETYDTSEVSRYSFTAGISVLYYLNERLSLGSALLLSDKGEQTKTYSKLQVNNYVNHYYFLDVPLKINYILFGKKAKFFLTTGLSANIYLKGRTVVKTNSTGDQKNITPAEEVLPVSFSWFGGFGLDCALTDRWYFRLEPNYKRSITSATGSPVKKYFYSAGISLGFFCRI